MNNFRRDKFHITHLIVYCIVSSQKYNFNNIIRVIYNIYTTLDLSFNFIHYAYFAFYTTQQTE